MNILLFILVSISITSAIQNEVVFSWFRSLIKKIYLPAYNFLICPTCFGFWVGILISFFFELDPHIIVNMFMCGFVSSIVNKTYAERSDGFSIE